MLIQQYNRYLYSQIQGWGYSDIFIHTLARAIFWGFKILKFNFFGGFQKNKCLFGYEDFVDIFSGSSQNWSIFSGNFYAF